MYRLKSDILCSFSLSLWVCYRQFEEETNLFTRNDKLFPFQFTSLSKFKSNFHFSNLQIYVTVCLAYEFGDAKRISLKRKQLECEEFSKLHQSWQKLTFTPKILQKLPLLNSFLSLATHRSKEYIIYLAIFYYNL